MLPEEVRTAAQARAIVEARGLNHVKFGIFDNDGILRGKYINRDKFFSGLDKGLGFCDVVLGWDSNDQQYDNVRFTGWHTAYPDAMVRLLPGTCRSLPLDPYAPAPSAKSAASRQTLSVFIFPYLSKTKW